MYGWFVEQVSSLLDKTVYDDYVADIAEDYDIVREDHYDSLSVSTSQSESEKDPSGTNYYYFVGVTLLVAFPYLSSYRRERTYLWSMLEPMPCRWTGRITCQVCMYTCHMHYSTITVENGGALFL